MEDRLQHYVNLIERLKPGEMITISMRELEFIGHAHLVGMFGPSWNPVDRIMENIVGSAYSIVAAEDFCRREVTFHRLEKPTDGERMTYVSPDRRDRYDKVGSFYVRKQQAAVEAAARQD